MTAHLIEPSMNASARLVDEIYRLRHVVFKRNLDWDVECLHGREIDQFDTDETVYGAVTDEFGEIEGCFRLLPTTGPYMLQDIFPVLLHGHPAPSDPQVMECSRFAVFPNSGQRRSISELLRVTGQLLVIQLEYCLDHDIHTMVCATDLRFERILRGAGLACTRYGPPVSVGNTVAVAGYMRPTEHNLAAVRARLSALHAVDRRPMPHIPATHDFDDVRTLVPAE